VATIGLTGDTDVSPEDFDEDLAELEENDKPGKERDSAAECECDRSDDSEYDCYSEDEESLRSYAGSELKDVRETRK
jgi:hypothetical protein